jgi:hypothetical protein
MSRDQSDRIGTVHYAERHLQRVLPARISYSPGLYVASLHHLEILPSFTASHISFPSASCQSQELQRTPRIPLLAGARLSRELQGQWIRTIPELRG